jgi:arsenate reductase-like glutaredoxin family protein
MAAGITLWGRSGDAETRDALAFLKAHRYAADRVLDVAAAPPTAEEAARIARSGAVAQDAQGRWRAPILLTPKGAIVGFRERRWREFLDIGKGRN